MLRARQYSNKRIIYTEITNTTYYYNIYTLGYYNLQHKVRYQSYLASYNLIVLGEMLHRIAQFCSLQFEDGHEAWNGHILVRGMVVVFHNFGNEGSAFFFMYTLLGCTVDSYTDTSVILHSLSWNFEIDPFCVT